MAYLGRQPVIGNFVRQEPTTAYTASGTSLTLTSATASSDDMYCVYLGKAVQTVNPPSGSVGASQLASDAVTAAKLNNDIISGSTELAATPAGTDELLISDAGTLKRIDYSLIKPTNTPNFYAHQSGGGQQSISNTTNTVMVFDQEDYDTGSDYDTSNGRFTPGEAGKYFLHSIVRLDSGNVDFDTFTLRILKNGSLAYNFTAFHSNYNSVAVSGIVQANGSSDYFQIDIYQNSGSSKNVTTNKNYTFFQGFKIIE